MEILGRCSFCRRKARPGPNGMAVVCKRHKNRPVLVDATFSVAPYVIAPEQITVQK
jgi:hypothetical protein